MLLARRRHGNLNVLAESRQKVDEPAYGENGQRGCGSRRRDVRLLNAEDIRGLDLGQATILDDAGDLERQPGFGQLLIRMRQTEIGEHVAAAFKNIVNLDRFAGTGHGQLCLSLS